jgi:hypothetical protein
VNWAQAREDSRVELRLSSCEADENKKFLALVEDLKKRGVTGGLVTRLFYR